jgi:tetratricopeptide (TPR) repeat protein
VARRRLRSIDVVACLLLSAALCVAQDPASPSAALTKAHALLDAGNPAGAIEMLTPIASRFPQGSAERREAAQLLGLSHYLAGHLAEAIPYLEEVGAATADSKVAYALAMAYAQTRRPDKAREAIARTFQLPRDSAAAYLLTGQMMNRLELEDQAEAALRQALAKDPRLPEVHYLLGQIAVFRSRYDEGVSLMRAELVLNPAHAMALYWIGDIYSRQANWPQAITALQQSIWINPYFSGPYILLGKAYSRTSRPAEAEDMLRHAIQYDPNNKTAHYLLAQVLQQAGRVDEARKEFEIAARLQGDIK